MVDIALLENIFAKKSEGQTLSVEEEEILDSITTKGFTDESASTDELLTEDQKTSSDSITELASLKVGKNQFEGVALVCTKAKNGIPILYEFKGVELARLIANKIMKEEF